VHTIVVLQEGYRGLQDRGLVHLSAGCGYQGAQVVDQRVELIPPLLLAEITRFSAKEATS